MLKQLFDLIAQVVSLTKTTEENTAGIKELQKEVRDLAETVRTFSVEMKYLRQLGEKDQQTFMLLLDQKLRELERRLPPPSGTDGSESKGQNDPANSENSTL